MRGGGKKRGVGEAAAVYSKNNAACVARMKTEHPLIVLPRYPAGKKSSKRQLIDGYLHEQTNKRQLQQ